MERIDVGRRGSNALPVVTLFAFAARILFGVATFAAFCDLFFLNGGPATFGAFAGRVSGLRYVGAVAVNSDAGRIAC